MTKKLPHQISTEDLLKSLADNPELESQPTDLDFEYRNDVPQFLSHFKIEAGEFPVKKHLIRRLYLQYTKHKVSPHSFGVSVTTFVQFDVQNYFINIPQAEIYKLVTKKQYKPNRYSPSNPTTVKHYETFLKDVGLIKGNRWIKIHYLFYLYSRYCKQNRKSHRFKLKMFTRITKMYFDSKRTTHYWTHIKVDESIMNLFNEQELEMLKNGKAKE